MTGNLGLCYGINSRTGARKGGRAQNTHMQRAMELLEDALCAAAQSTRGVLAHTVAQRDVALRQRAALQERLDDIQYEICRMEYELMKCQNTIMSCPTCSKLYDSNN